ncbi:MAG: cytochrome c maturation protein CcmE [Porticoccaceae bacterium]|jgi:cytochrome c-type biogenesis protein CcmE
MHPIRKQRLQVVLLIVIASSAAVGLVAYMLGQNANYFFTPSQVLQGEAPDNVTIRAGGMVVKGSIERSTDSLDVSFLVSDGMANLRVSYSGILPDLFAEDEAAIATGKLDKNNVLQATQVLAKHDENYTPPEVADAMNKAYEIKQKQKQQQYQEAYE